MSPYNIEILNVFLKTLISGVSEFSHDRKLSGTTNVSKAEM